MNWTEFGKNWNEFERAGLNKPGVLIETGDGETLLVGHVNTVLGPCGCCAEPGHAVIVNRYRVVWVEGGGDG